VNYPGDLIYRLRARESERRIAADLGISRPTVAKRHALAECQGYLAANAAPPDHDCFAVGHGRGAQASEVQSYPLPPDYTR
jgi:hypothetical protein